ncbi:MAG: SDR family oxidoreductase [Desulfobacteraceae bacterium]|nr:MAG: SDR family oxidoreductase [Desulfobacteraceae bacterium]
MKKYTVLILGVTGMLGHTLFNELSKNPELDVFGTARNINGIKNVFQSDFSKKIRSNVDAENFDSVNRAMASIQPDIVINCIGLIKQLPIANDPLSAVTVNAQLPHRISLICKTAKARMIHISTDCVFDGMTGGYQESDPSTANDLYGKTKYLGEVDYPHCLTMRTSIIGHELKTRLGLVDWFLSQKEDIKGFTKAIYTGFPTVEIADIISRWIIPNPDLSGLYHVSSAPISKYDLLKIIAERYDKKIHIEPSDEFKCDRSLNSERFQSQTGYSPPSWPELVDKMYDHYHSSGLYTY